MIAPKRGPGRPPTGQAMTSTQRNRARRERLQSQGCRLLGSVVLTPEAAAALDRLTAGGATIDEAISQALSALAQP
ncbi:hypothetical protein [Roseateles sp. LKC17W]|uniref:Uncharacterized protein n=1 Tax=Pelomonas margarita TaxID=3299031 RepID=A0ABW7FFV5_9BURK